MANSKSELEQWRKRMWKKYHKGEPYPNRKKKSKKKPKNKVRKLSRNDQSIKERLDSGAAYKIYFKSLHWRTLRKFTIEKRGNKCECCGIGSNLQVHHKTYTENR